MPSHCVTLSLFFSPFAPFRDGRVDLECRGVIVDIDEHDVLVMLLSTTYPAEYQGKQVHVAQVNVPMGSLLGELTFHLVGTCGESTTPIHIVGVPLGCNFRVTYSWPGYCLPLLHMSLCLLRPQTWISE